MIAPITLTYQRPIEPGYYWCYNPREEGSKAFIAQVTESFNGFSMALMDHDSSEVKYYHFDSAYCVGLQWSERIPDPAFPEV